MRRISFTILALFSLVLIVQLNAQNKIWELRAFKYEPFDEIILDNLSADTLYFITSDTLAKVNISLIIDLKWDGESHSGTGALQVLISMKLNITTLERCLWKKEEHFSLS